MYVFNSAHVKIIQMKFVPFCVPPTVFLFLTHIRSIMCFIYMWLKCVSGGTWRVTYPLWLSFDEDFSFILMDENVEKRPYEK